MILRMREARGLGRMLEEPGLGPPGAEPTDPGTFERLSAALAMSSQFSRKPKRTNAIAQARDGLTLCRSTWPALVLAHSAPPPVRAGLGRPSNRAGPGSRWCALRLAPFVR